jgi:hypothetical protein
MIEPQAKLGELKLVCGKELLEFAAIEPDAPAICARVDNYRSIDTAVDP